MSKSSGSAPNFAERLQTARERRKLSQSELAVKAGFQPSAISHFETGRRAPSFDNLKRLADALDVTTDYLLGRTDDFMVASSTADQLARDASKVSQEDLQLLLRFAADLAKRNEKKT